MTVSSETPTTATPPEGEAKKDEAPKKPLKERLQEKLGPLVAKLRQKSSDSGISGNLGVLFRSPFSPSWPTRKMGALFIASVLGLALVSTVTVRRYLYLRRLHQHRLTLAELERKKLGEFFERQAAEARDRLSWIELGRYTFETLPVEKDALGKTIRSLAEIELSAKCADRATAEYIEARMTEARNEITSALAGVEKEELMSPEGKRRMKKRIVERLNSWITVEFPKGKVQDVFFSSLIVS